MPINYKGKMSNLILEEPHRKYLNKVIEVNFFSNTTNVNHILSDRM